MKTNENLIAKVYEKSIDQDVKKSMGKYYTPEFIINYIIEKTMKNLDIIKNPFVKIIDPACGVGYFLLAAYDKLEEYFIENINKLKVEYKSKTYKMKLYGEEMKICGNDYWKLENIHYHILTHCIHGADKDKIAVKLTIDALRKKNEDFYVENLNIFYCDSLIYWEDINKDKIDKSSEKQYIEKLIKFWGKKYDYVIGNPPYVGHKKLSFQYKEWLLKEYNDVFQDKADILFCFFKRIESILAVNGVCGLITSRYFMESPNGIYLRDYLMKNIELIEIVDFNGESIFKGVSVATAIYFFKLKTNKENYFIKVKKLNNDSINKKENIVKDKKLNLNRFDSFNLPSERLKAERWLILSEESYIIYKKIEDKCKFKLRDIAFSFQGIITGCDNAFVLNHELILKKHIEKEIIKPWIKNKNIKKYSIKRDDLYLIYSDNIESPSKYPNSMEYIGKYKNKLKNRRECKNGVRKWYHLQWGRKEELFEQKKIIFPYKSKTNEFSIDHNNLYFSADIYGLIIKEDFKEIISLEYLIGILNSKVYEFYFKLFAKKMGREIYDYYPNSILDLSIISEEIIESIERLSKEIMNKQDNTENFKREIDDIIMNYFEFSTIERQIIENKF